MTTLDLDPALVARARELAARAAQPVVDLAHRHTTVSVERALAANPFAGFSDAGVGLALGSDAPVTPLDPWGGVHAAIDHRTPGSGLRPFDAFDAATHGGRFAVRAEHRAGPLAVGAPASLALWATEQTLSAVLAGRLRPACRLLLVNGDPV